MSEFAQPDQFAALYRECVSKAANDGKRLMEHLVDNTRTSLQQRASVELDPRERNVLQEASRMLSTHEALLRDRFPMALLAAFSEAVAADPKPRKLADAQAPPDFAASLRFDELELMDDGQIQESIELARAQQNAMATADLQLAELNGLVCAVLGLKTVQPDRNPLRPEVYVKALRTVVMLTNVDNLIRVRWMQFMGMALGQHLREAYPEISEFLKSRGVRAVGYVVTQTAQAGNPPVAMARPGNVGAGGGGAVAGAPGGTGANGGGFGGTFGGTYGAGPQYGVQALLTVDQLRRLLSGELDNNRQGAASGRDSLRGPITGSGGSGGGGGGGGGGGFNGYTADGAIPFDLSPEDVPPDFANTVPAAFDALEEMRAADQVIKRLAERRAASASGTPNTQSSGLDTTLDGLRRDARGLGQALGLEVVNLMFENISHDPHVLPPIQALLRKAEPAYLRLALIDPRFFSDKQHVARRLLDQITERSLAYPTVVAPGFEVFLKVLREATDVLAISQIRDVSPFEYALKTLEAEWRRQERREGKQREKAVHALLHAEQRNLLAERMGREIRRKPGASMAPSEVVNFLVGPWSQVMAEARLGDRKGSPDPRGYMSVANDLIWTTQQEQSRENLARIQDLIPQLLERIREGLELIDFPPTQAENFSGVLLAIYENVMHSGAGRSSIMPSRQDGGTTRSNTDDPWLAPTEMQHTGFLDLPDDQKPAFDSTAPELDDDPRSAKPGERSKPPIPPGAWVELSLHDQVLRAQLTWSSPYGTLFMFTDSTGTTHSLTRRALDKLLSRGSVTLISQGVVDDALDAVARKAMSNSLDLNL